jgi:hypothetical protein
VTIVLQCRRSIAARIRDPAEAGGSFALLRNWLARVWRYIAIFYIIGLWVVSAFGAPPISIERAIRKPRSAALYQ